MHTFFSILFIVRFKITLLANKHVGIRTSFRQTMQTQHVYVLCVYVGAGCYFFLLLRMVITQGYSHSLYRKEHNQINGGSLINHSGKSSVEYES